MTWVVRAPDARLAQAEKKVYSRVRRVLWDYEPLRASHAEIFIDVDGHNVRLRGRVRTLPQKIIAETLVARMDDVGSLTNELIADPDVVRAVADALAEDDRTAAYVLRVDARHGLVILRGEVPSEAVQQAAIDIASSVPIVNSVRNQLTVGGAALPAVALARPSTTADELDPVEAKGVRA
ncbi:MAG: BON domain-containing protein [Chloroflexota bacterium]|nr:BON domain-containing protein [Chloroflexota bacterium]